MLNHVRRYGNLPDHLDHAVREAVAGGDYGSEAEVVLDALEIWAARRQSASTALEALRAAIRAGEESGPDIPAEQVFADLRARIRRKHAA